MATMIMSFGRDALNEIWPCNCTDPGHAIDEYGCYECTHGKWELNDGKWGSWYWGDCMFDEQKQADSELTEQQRAKIAAAKEMEHKQMEVAARQYVTAQRVATTNDGKIAFPCKYMCHSGIAGKPEPANKGWKAGCSVKDCKYIHPKEKGWDQVVLKMVNAGKLKMPQPVVAQAQQKPANKFAMIGE